MEAILKLAHDGFAPVPSPEILPQISKIVRDLKFKMKFEWVDQSSADVIDLDSDTSSNISNTPANLPTPRPRYNFVQPKSEVAQHTDNSLDSDTSSNLGDAPMANIPTVRPPNNDRQTSSEAIQPTDNGLDSDTSSNLGGTPATNILTVRSQNIVGQLKSEAIQLTDTSSNIDESPSADVATVRPQVDVTQPLSDDVRQEDNDVDDHSQIAGTIANHCSPIYD
jgi:hypothetical protein